MTTELKNGATYRLPNDRQSGEAPFVWIEVGDVSVRILRINDIVVVDMWPNDEVDEVGIEPIAAASTFSVAPVRARVEAAEAERRQRRTNRETPRSS